MGGTAFEGEQRGRHSAGSRSYTGVQSAPPGHSTRQAQNSARAEFWRTSDPFSLTPRARSPVRSTPFDPPSSTRLSSHLLAPARFASSLLYRIGVSHTRTPNRRRQERTPSPPRVRDERLLIATRRLLLVRSLRRSLETAKPTPCSLLAAPFGRDDLPISSSASSNGLSFGVQMSPAKYFRASCLLQPDSARTFVIHLACAATGLRVPP